MERYQEPKGSQDLVRQRYVPFLGQALPNLILDGSLNTEGNNG